MFRPLLLVISLTFLISGCASSGGGSAEDRASASSDTGTLIFTANGEDFVRQGFTSKDGWEIDFDHLFVTFSDITAFQSSPPYDATRGTPPSGPSVSLPGPVTVDLTEVRGNATATLIGEISHAPGGQYNALSWRMTPVEVVAGAGAPTGATIAMLGSATRGSDRIEFQINDATEYAYNCGEYVGDGRKGILQPAGQAELEATLHFDHLFGDAEAPAEDALNVNAAGFDQFAALAVDDQLEVWVSDLNGSWPAEDVTRFRDALASLGHVGEGHCTESGGGYTGQSNGR